MVEKICIAGVRRYNMLLVLKTQADKGMVPVVQGNCNGFPQPYDANMKILFNSPTSSRTTCACSCCRPRATLTRCARACWALVNF